MSRAIFRFAPVFMTVLVLSFVCSTTSAQVKIAAPKAKQDKKKKPAPFDVDVAKDKIHFKASGTWKKVKPRSRIVEFEIKVPKVAGDVADGRLTIMGAGGSIEANIDRWEKQFTGSEEDTKVNKIEIADQKVTMVEITGDYTETMGGGPFSGGKKIERKNYCMLAAIIQTEENGNYFVKLYGPKKTVSKNAEHFKAMIKTLKVDGDE